MEFRQIWSHWPPPLSGAREYSTSYTQNSCQSFILLNQKSCLAKKLFLDWRTIWCRFTSACCFIFGQMMEGGMAVDGQTGRQKCVTRKYRTNWYLNGLRIKQWILEGLWSGSVGRVVASNSRGPRFESIHRQILFTINCIKDKKKRPAIAHLILKNN